MRPLLLVALLSRNIALCDFTRSIAFVNILHVARRSPVRLLLVIPVNAGRGFCFAGGSSLRLLCPVSHGKGFWLVVAVSRVSDRC